MAVTHADLEIGRSCNSLGSRWGVMVMAVCTMLGLIAFILSLIAETARSEVLWLTEIQSGDKGKEELIIQCLYTRSGKTPGASACGALLALVVAQALSQIYMGIALCSPPSVERARPLYAWTSSANNNVSSLKWKAAVFFITLWICFAVATVLLLIGVIVEAEHVRDSGKLHDKCLVVRQGLFVTAGVFTLSCTSLGVAFFITARQTHRAEEAEAQVRQEVVETTMLSSVTPPPPPQWPQDDDDDDDDDAARREAPPPPTQPTHFMHSNSMISPALKAQ